MNNKAIIHRTKFGLMSRTKAQLLICENCLMNPDYECKQPCSYKKNQQIRPKTESRMVRLFENPDIHILDRNFAFGFGERSNGCKLDIDPNRIEEIQQANLSQNINMATMTNFRQAHYRRGNKFMTRITKDGHVWENWKW